MKPPVQIPVGLMLLSLRAIVAGQWSFRSARFAFVVLFFSLFTCPSQAAWEYVKPAKYYVFDNKLYFPKSPALTARLSEFCRTNYIGEDCRIEYIKEEYSSSAGGWYWRVAIQYSRGTQLHVADVSSLLATYCPVDGGWKIGIAEPLCYRENILETDCDECQKNRHPLAQPPKVGNPIFPSNLMKQEVRLDYQSASGSLRFVWTYRSDLNRWAHNYEMSLSDMNAPTYGDGPEGACYLEANRYMGAPGTDRHCYPYAANGKTRDVALRKGNSRVRYFSSGENYAAEAGSRDRLTPILDESGAKTGWEVKDGQTLATESYDAVGRLIASKELNGQETTFAYSDGTTLPEAAPRPGLLIRVTDAFGATLSFSYDQDGRMSAMIDPAGGRYAYAYDAKGNLASVIYPDDKKISYLYNEVGKVTVSVDSLLTGIIDENGSRYASFTYSDYKAVSTEHAGGVNKYSLKASGSNWTTVTDPLGTARDYTYYTVIGGIKQFTGIYQPAPSGTGVNNTYVYYDTIGNVTSFLDLNGKRTVYTYDPTRNLQTKRVEASGTTLATTTSTEWHATLELPTRIAEPKRLTTNTYDNSGNLLTQTVQATTDGTGAAGFSAVVTGLPQTRTYTYNTLGQRLTAKGPRSDVNDQTTYTYDSAGNLTSITNAAGHVTTLSNYDAHGRAGRITDPNGLNTDFSYTVRGWLSSVSNGGETTSYDYDGVGQMTKATLPDGSSISYIYDAAHRLTNIADSAGNAITYTLDKMGNRTGEQVKDADGVLARQISRAYDPLNRLKQITGALQ